MPKKKTAADPPLSPTANIHVGLLQKAGAAFTSAKWSSPGKLSKKLQPKLFGCSSLQVRDEKAMIGEEVLLDGEDLYTDGVPSDLEDRYYRYRVDCYNEGKGKACTFNLTYLEQCTKYSGSEWISLPDESEDGSEKLLVNFPKDLVLEGHVRMREKRAVIREHTLQKNNVLKASLAITRTVPLCAEDVDITDLLRAANADREKGWSSDQVIQWEHKVKSCELYGSKGVF